MIGEAGPEPRVVLGPGAGGVAGKCVTFGNGCGSCVPVCDADGDGFCPGNPGSGQPGGYCDDRVATVSPKDTEICNNNRDDNCNSDVDEGFST